MECDIIIPVWNELQYTRRCIESIQPNTKIPYRLILVDNGSDNETRNYLQQLAQQNGNITLIRNKENLGFVKAVNQGLRESNAPYVCVVNNDTVVTDGWLSRLMDLAEGRPEIGLVTPQSESPGRLTVDEYAKLLALKKGEHIETNQCLWFCVLVKREVIDKVGYLDEIYGMGGFDDADFAMRAHKIGYKCTTACDAYVYHVWHASFKKAGNREKLVKRNEKIFFDKWGKFLRIAYPILSDSPENFSCDIYTSLGLAREWNWIHTWLSIDRNQKKLLNSMSLPRHQNMRLFFMGKNRILFFAEVLFRLVERSLKRKKHFDAVLTSDPDLFRVLSRFKKLFRAPVFYIKRETSPIDTRDENSWSRRAHVITNIIKKGIRR